MFLNDYCHEHFQCYCVWLTTLLMIKISSWNGSVPSYDVTRLYWRKENEYLDMYLIMSRQCQNTDHWKRHYESKLGRYISFFQIISIYFQVVIHIFVYSNLFSIDAVKISISFSGYKSVESVPQLVEDYLSGKLKVDEFVTHNMPLDEVNEAFNLMHAGKRYQLHTICRFQNQGFNTLRHEQNGWHFADESFECSFVNENYNSFIQIWWGTNW